jgi:hypothetical protein
MRGQCVAPVDNIQASSAQAAAANSHNTRGVLAAVLPWGPNAGPDASPTVAMGQHRTRTVLATTFSLVATARRGGDARLVHANAVT